MLDTTFDFRSDAGNGDPDTTSPTLRRYHQLLWSKALPGGHVLTLDTSRRTRYLHHDSGVGEFFLASDTVIPTFRGWVLMAPIIEQLPTAELDEFQYLNHTIGGMMVFPGDRREGVQTLNGARGFTRQISDRFDLTLECIRLHYLSKPNPLSRPLTAYNDFFQVFGNFEQYVDFFLLNDLVAEDYSSVEFFAPFDDFKSSGLPQSVEAYRAYRDLCVKFITARNQRIADWAGENLPAE